MSSIEDALILKILHFLDSYSTASSVSLNQSIASLHLEGDLLEHFGLTEFQPTELHVVALYGVYMWQTSMHQLKLTFH